MLVPALLHKDEVEKEFAKYMYSEGMFYYHGYAHGHGMTEIKPKDNVYQWAIMGRGVRCGTCIDGSTSVESPLFKDKVIGYFAYRIDPWTDRVYNFGLYSFDPGNLLVPHGVFNKMKELVEEHHGVEWRCISGNPAMKGYTRFMMRMEKKHPEYHTCVHRLKDFTKDNQGNYRDEYIFEIVHVDEP